MEPAPTTILTYAPRPPFHRRRRFRHVLLLILGAALAAAAYRWVGPAWRQGQLLYAQRQCLTYTAPADQVVYEEDPITPSPLLGQPGYQSMPGARPMQSWSSSPNTDPARPPVATFLAPCLQAYASLLGVPVVGATLFLHERRTPSGLRRLVVVQRRPTQFLIYTKAFDLNPGAVELVSWSGQPDTTLKVSAYVWSGGPTHEPSTTGLRFYAGQPDPADPAHFTIAYDLDGGQGIIDGRLSDDGSQVLLHVRTGPASGDSPWSMQVYSKDPPQSSVTVPIP